MHSYDHRIQCFAINSYLLTWRSEHSDTPTEPWNAATMDRASAKNACALYGLVLPDEPTDRGRRARRILGRFLDP